MITLLFTAILLVLLLLGEPLFLLIGGSAVLCMVLFSGATHLTELSSLIDDVFPFAGARCDGLMRRVLAGLARQGVLPGPAPAEKPLTPTVDQQENPS